MREANKYRLTLNCILLLMAMIYGCAGETASLKAYSKECLATLNPTARQGFDVNNVIVSDDLNNVAWIDHVNKMVVLLADKKITTYENKPSGILLNINDKNVHKSNFHIFFAPYTNKLFFKAKKDNQEHVVFGDKQGRYYDEVRGLVFGPKKDQFAFIAKTGDKESVVLNGDREQKEYAKISDSSLQFNKDGSEIAYIAQKQIQTLKVKQQECLVVGNKEGQCYFGISQLALSPDFKKSVYFVVESATNHFVVDNGKITDSGIFVTQSTASPDSKHIAYVCKAADSFGQRCAYNNIADAKQYVIEDGKRISNNYDEIYSLRYSNSNKLSFVARKDSLMFLIIVGKESRKIRINGTARGSTLLAEHGDAIALKIQNTQSKQQIVFKDYPCPLFDRIDNAQFSPDGQRIAYFGFRNDNSSAYSGLYVNGVRIIKHGGLLISPDFRSVFGERDLENRFGSNSARINCCDTEGNEMDGPWFDWVSQPKFVPDDKSLVQYLALDGDKIWRICSKI